MKRITITWTALLIIMIACLTIIGLHIKKEKINNLMEMEIVKQTERYLGLYTNLYPKKGSITKLKVQELIDAGYDPLLENGCDGYVVIEPESIGFKYSAYIKCPDYITEGYEEQ